MLLALALKTEFPQAKVNLKARTVIAYPDMMTAEQLAAFDADERDIPFACPNCGGSGDELDENFEVIDLCGCRRCSGYGYLERQEFVSSEFKAVL